MDIWSFLTIFWFFFEFFSQDPATFFGFLRDLKIFHRKKNLAGILWLWTLPKNQKKIKNVGKPSRDHFSVTFWSFLTIFFWKIFEPMLGFFDIFLNFVRKSYGRISRHWVRLEAPKKLSRLREFHPWVHFRCFEKWIFLWFFDVFEPMLGFFDIFSDFVRKSYGRMSRQWVRLEAPKKISGLREFHPWVHFRCFEKWIFLWLCCFLLKFLRH